MASSVIEAGGDPDDFFFDNGYTDGFPIVVPTRGRVAAMLRGSQLADLAIIGQCPPSYADLTVEKLAIAAVMAGCTPEMFRIVVAATRAALQPEFNLHGVGATTMGATPAVIVNGPCRHAANVQTQHGVCGSGHRSHSIARALKLAMQNVGRARLAGTESTTLGTPMKFGLCFGEWEERAGMWEPLAVEMGVAERDQDAVTVMAVQGGPTQLVDFSSTPAELVARLAKFLTGACSPQIPMVNSVLLVVSPEHYDTLLKCGMSSKAFLARTLWLETCKNFIPHVAETVRSLISRKRPNSPFFLKWTAGFIAAIVALALRLCGSALTAIPKFNNPASFKIVVAGGGAGKFSCFMPGFGFGREGMSTYKLSTPVCMTVEPRPDALDQPLPVVSRASDILHPGAEQVVAATSLATRTGCVQGPVALVDISKARGSELLDAFESKLQEEGVEIRRYSKPTFAKPCPPDLQKRIATECRSAILALAD